MAIKIVEAEPQNSRFLNVLKKKKMLLYMYDYCLAIQNVNIQFQYVYHNACVFARYYKLILMFYSKYV